MHFVIHGKITAPGFTPDMEIQDEIEWNIIVHDGVVVQSNKKEK
jgi:hypothetical protein